MWYTEDTSLHSEGGLCVRKDVELIRNLSTCKLLRVSDTPSLPRIVHPTLRVRGYCGFVPMARGDIHNGQPSRWIMSMPIFCPTPLLVSETRYFRNPTRNERSECRVGYADDARVQACRRHATTHAAPAFYVTLRNPQKISPSPSPLLLPPRSPSRRNRTTSCPKSLNKAPKV